MKETSRLIVSRKPAREREQDKGEEPFLTVFIMLYARWGERKTPLANSYSDRCTVEAVHSSLPQTQSECQNVKRSLGCMAGCLPIYL